MKNFLRNQQPATSNQQPATSNQRPATSPVIVTAPCISPATGIEH